MEQDQLQLADALRDQAVLALNELYKLGEHEKIKIIIKNCELAYKPKDPDYNLNEVVKNPVKPETKARLDKLILNK